MSTTAPAEPASAPASPPSTTQAGKIDSATRNPLARPDSDHVEQLRAQRIGETSPKYRGTLARAFAGTASPRQAIRAFCLHCVGDMRLDVTNCTAYACPLFEYRPFQRGDEDELELDATAAAAAIATAGEAEPSAFNTARRNEHSRGSS